MKNQVQLIAYVDRLSGGGLKTLHELLNGPLARVFGGVHLLPFFHTIDGSDAGFDPIDHTRVDERLGDWEDVARLSKDVDIMADVIVNHMSSESPQFKDYSEKGSGSPYHGMFLTYESVFPNGATEQELLAIYRPRPGLPFTYATLANGEKKILWTTFTSKQVDIDLRHPQGQAYIEEILRVLAGSGVRMIRLDAVGYAMKRAGDSCFMTPETFDFIEGLAQTARSMGLEVLVEVHSYFRKQIEIAQRVDWVYDFALPPLVLHAVFFRTARFLKAWTEVRPVNALTVLDTHDGIGIIDIGPDHSGPVERPGLVPDAELNELVEIIHRNSGGQSREATGAAASNLDLYQVNCTFYDALGRDDRAYLAARAIQFFMPGIPQVYYVGLLAGSNDMDLLRRTRVGRDINRHYYTREEVEAELKRPVVRRLIELIRLRNTHPAFQGEFTVMPSKDEELVLRWKAGAAAVSLRVDFETMDHEISAVDGASTLILSF